MPLIRVVIEKVVKAGGHHLGVFEHPKWLSPQNPKNVVTAFDCLPGEDPEIDAVAFFTELDGNRADPIVPGKQVIVLPEQFAREGAVIGIRIGSEPLSVREED